MRLTVRNGYGRRPELIIDKISSAADFIKEEDGTIALTLYCAGFSAQGHDRLVGNGTFPRIL